MWGGWPEPPAGDGADEYFVLMRVIVCGEALIDLIPSEESRLGPRMQQESWQAVCGGSPMNSAVALARLGCDVEFLGRLGNDLFADQLEAHLARSGVGTKLLVRAETPTSLAVVNPLPDGVNLYSFHLQGTANFGWTEEEFPNLDESDWLHFGSLTPLIQPGATALLNWIRTLDSPLSVDINVRPSVEPDRDRYWAAVEQILTAVGQKHGIVKLSIEDLEWLVGGLDGGVEEAIELMAAWAVEYGHSLVLLTLGGDGAVAIKPDGRVERIRGIPVVVHDTVGAGDTFMAGFLSAWLEDPTDLEAALRTGAAAAAIVCTRIGADPPTKYELTEFMTKTAPSVKASMLEDADD